jgi:hypothetical protein
MVGRPVGTADLDMKCVTGPKRRGRANQVALPCPGVNLT